MRGLFRWLVRHPLVWLVPTLFFLALILYAVFQLTDAPSREFIYDL